MNTEESSGFGDTRRLTAATVLLVVALAVLAGFLVASVTVEPVPQFRDRPAGEVGSGLHLPLDGE